MTFRYLVTQDWKANSGNSKGRVVQLLFRLATLCQVQTGFVKLLCISYMIIYKGLVCWFLGIELPLKSKVGPGLRLFHGQSLVVHEAVEIGSNVTLRHCTTIGVKTTGDGSLGVPRISDDVDIGANAVIIGRLLIGRGAIIGAGSVVTKDVPEGGVAVGNPAVVLKIRDIHNDR